MTWVWATPGSVENPVETAKQTAKIEVFHVDHPHLPNGQVACDGQLETGASDKLMLNLTWWQAWLS